MKMVLKLAWFFFSLLYLSKSCWGQSSWTNILDSTCKFTTNHELSIPFERNPLLFIDRVNKPDVSSCRQMCCGHKTCNGYVWDASDNINQPCKLLKCSDEGTDCKNALTKMSIIDKSNHEVGFITGISDTTPSPLKAVLVTNSPTIKTSTKTTDKLSRITLTKTTPSINVDLHSVTTSTPVVINSNVQITTTTTTTTTTTKETVASTQSTTTAYKQNTTNMDQDQDDMAKILQGQKSQQSTVATTTTTKSTTLNQKIEDDSLPTTTSTTMMRKKHLHPKQSKNSTQVPQKGVIGHGNGNGHSDSISLTAAVFFGLAFMFVTMYLVGRRWLEGIRESKSRRGYTRISFLLNGDRT